MFGWRIPLSRSSAVIAIVATSAVLLILYVWQLWPFRDAIESTENSYVRGSVTIVAPKVDGYVAEVAVQDFASVVSGDVLVKLDDRIYCQRLEQAAANLSVQQAHLANHVQTLRVREAGLISARAAVASATAQVTNARAQLQRTNADLGRVDALMADGSLSRREYDQTRAATRHAEANLSQSEALVRQAESSRVVAEQELVSVAVTRRVLEGAVAAATAAVRLAEIDLENTRIRAPKDGHAGEVGVKLGQYVTPGTQLMAVVPAQVWIVANFKEAQTAHMIAGQAARMHVNALGGAELRGHVERISPATGSEFSVIKQDNATGNFTKIPQRLLVRIAIDSDAQITARLRPGMSVVTYVDTSGPRPRAAGTR